jgi:hypothetical protein
MEISQGLFWTVLLAASVFAGSAMAYEHGGIPSSDVGLSHHHPRAPRNPWAVSQIPDSTTSTAVDASSESNLRETSDGTPSVSSNSRASAAIDPPPPSYPTSYLEEVVQKLGLKGGHMDFIPFGESAGSNFGWGLGRAKGPSHRPMMLLQWGLP